MLVPFKFQDNCLQPFYFSEDERLNKLRTRAFLEGFSDSWCSSGILLLDKTPKEFLSEIKRNTSHWPWFFELINAIFNKHEVDKRIYESKKLGEPTIPFTHLPICSFVSQNPDNQNKFYRIDCFEESLLCKKSKNSQDLIAKDSDCTKIFDKYFYFPIKLCSSIDIIDRYSFFRADLNHGLKKFLTYIYEHRINSKIDSVKIYASKKEIIDLNQIKKNTNSFIFNKFKFPNSFPLKTINLILIEDKFFEEEMHDRFLLMDNFSFQLGKGFSVFNGSQDYPDRIKSSTMITRVNKEVVQIRLNKYSDYKYEAINIKL